MSSRVSRGVAGPPSPPIRLPRGVVRFLGVGLFGLAMQTGVFSALNAANINKSLAWLIGLAAATALTWALNRRFTFAASGRRRRSEVVRYGLVTLVAQSISFGVFRLMLAIMPHLAPSMDLIVGAVAATAFSYTGQRFFTFAPKPSPGTAEPRA